MSGAQFPDGLEIRSAAAELRSFPDSRTLTGYAAIWGTEARIGSSGGRGGGFRETIFPNAFQASLASGRDVVALKDHSPQHLLGRTKAGTLQLREDDIGLAFTLDLPPVSYADDLLGLIRSGNVGGCSFGLYVDGKDGERWIGDKRELRRVSLMEISLVSWEPAYPQTSVTARSRQHARPHPSAVLRRRLLEVL